MTLEEISHWAVGAERIRSEHRRRTARVRFEMLREALAERMRSVRDRYPQLRK